jgi:hypothetical protein
MPVSLSGAAAGGRQVFVVGRKGQRFAKLLQHDQRAPDGLGSGPSGGEPDSRRAGARLRSSRSLRALSLTGLEQRFSARGRWRDRLPTIVDTLEALGRARRAGGGDARWQSA